MTMAELAPLLALFFGGGAFVAIINAVAQHRKVGADATAVVTAAARELVDPLRRELSTERKEHAEEMELLRESHLAAFTACRIEMSAATAVAKSLREELHAARIEADALRNEREVHLRHIRELQGRLVGQSLPETGQGEHHTGSQAATTTVSGGTAPISRG